VLQVPFSAVILLTECQERHVICKKNQCLSATYLQTFSSGTTGGIKVRLENGQRTYKLEEYLLSYNNAPTFKVPETGINSSDTILYLTQLWK